ncbi:hypothetical protein M91_21675 [Bos mutus]|uniref:Uncharacterized protein n=1 Tax=Bos mutus TaxID=72004 RepID=L8HMG2_9CETA|nr:hypothetical protein M91_21675 [Bos mutus]
MKECPGWFHARSVSSWKGYKLEVLGDEDLSLRAYSEKLEKLGAPRGVKTSPAALRLHWVFKKPSGPRGPYPQSSSLLLSHLETKVQSLPATYPDGLDRAQWHAARCLPRRRGEAHLPAQTDRLQPPTLRVASRSRRTWIAGSLARVPGAPIKKKRNPPTVLAGKPGTGQEGSGDAASFPEPRPITVPRPPPPWAAGLGEAARNCSRNRETSRGKLLPQFAGMSPSFVLGSDEKVGWRQGWGAGGECHETKWEVAGEMEKEYGGRRGEGTGHPDARTRTHILPRPQLCASQSLSRSYGSGLPTSLTYIVPTCQRLFTLETCCGYGYGPARDLHPLPRIFKGQRELTGRRRNRDAFQGTGPSLGANPFQGALPFTKKRELSPGLPPASPGSVALPHWTPRGAHLRHSGFGDLNPTPFRSAEGNGGHRPSLRNGARPSLRTD